MRLSRATGRRRRGPGRAVAERVLGLGPATHRYTVERDLAMETPDGVTLLATRFVPEGTTRGPVVLIRTPYGRDGRVWTATLPGPLAARGHQVVVQSVRGTFGSGGGFDPGRHERADGVATVAWLRARPWCDGRVATAGGSYLGLTQWALAAGLEEPPSALCVSIGASSMVDGWYPGGALALDQTLRWAWLVAHQEERLGGFSLLWGGRRIARALRAGAVRDADVAAFGARSPMVRERFEHVDDPAHWVGVVDHRDARGHVAAPTSTVTGWSDLFLRDQLADHRAQAAAGHDARITIGPWSHSSPGLLPVALRDTLEVLDQVHRGRPAPARAPVRLFVQGLGAWRGYASWPPPSSPLCLRLGPDGEVGPDRGGPGGDDGGDARAADPVVSYDPADPTPAVGGPSLNPPAGSRHQAAVEARPDVLVHTGDVLTAPLEIVGDVTATVPATVSAGTGGGLVVVRLCDVDAAGRSRNVTEGVLRVPPPDTGVPRTLHVDLDPTAHHFAAGHRLRVHLAAGAHPRVGDPDGAPYTVTVHHTPRSGPTLTLPVVGTDTAPDPRP